MFKKILLPFFYLVSSHCFATIRTVSNNPGNPAQFTTIQAAVDASSSGDSVYIHPGINTFGNATINNKALKLFGAGWSPDKKTVLNTLVTNIFLTGTVDGTEIHGLHFVFGNSIQMLGRNNIRIIRNYFEDNTGVNFGCGFANSQNIYIEGNFFNYNSFILTDRGCSSDPNAYTRLSNSIIINNLFICGPGGVFRGLKNTANVVVDHNLFTYTGFVFTSGSENFLMKNNVFVNCNPTGTNNEWINNITFNCVGTNSPWTSGTNSGTGNIENENPQMTNQTAINANQINPVEDFTIAAGPANNAATDGKDMGLLFNETGSLNWAKSRNSRLPRILNFMLPNSVIQQGGTLEVNLKAVKSN